MLQKELTYLVRELKTMTRDFRKFLFVPPKTKYQFWDKVQVITLIIFPLIVIVLTIIFRR